MSTLDIAWEERVVRLRDLGGKPGTDHEIVLNVRRRLVLDGERWATMKEGDSVNLESGQLLSVHNVGVFDGQRLLGYHEVIGTSKGGALAAKGSPGAKSNPAGEHEYAPIGLVFRPLQWILEDKERRPNGHNPLMVHSEHGVINGHKCIIMDVGQPPMIEQVWLDSEREFIVVRHVIYTLRDKPWSQTDILYPSSREMGHWIPSGWKSVQLGPTGAVVHSLTATVKSAVINKPTPENVWSFTFPPDTWVIDDIQKREYIIRASGPDRLILRDELHRKAKYEDFLETETGYAPAGRSFSVMWMWITMLAIVLLVMLFAVLRRRHAAR